ncbi:hypothetical protein M9Y10_037955 [Tritrichomonas musculus]|uniref:Uncharacterized protein n=1 Tax=Tritrichomonas musculus TaxID=1915356 RepID=A0ABR2K8X5_9EUKA
MSEYFKYSDDFGLKPESYHFITPDRYPSDPRHNEYGLLVMEHICSVNESTSSVQVNEKYINWVVAH